MMGLGVGDNKKRTIHDCALEGDIAALDNLLREKPTLLRAKDDSGREALHWAVSRFSKNISTPNILGIFLSPESNIVQYPQLQS